MFLRLSTYICIPELAAIQAATTHSIVNTENRDDLVVDVDDPVDDGFDGFDIDAQEPTVQSGPESPVEDEQEGKYSHSITTQLLNIE